MKRLFRFQDQELTRMFDILLIEQKMAAAFFFQIKVKLQLIDHLFGKGIGYECDGEGHPMMIYDLRLTIED